MHELVRRPRRSDGAEGVNAVKDLQVRRKEK